MNAIDYLASLYLGYLFIKTIVKTCQRVIDRRDAKALAEKLRENQARRRVMEGLHLHHDGSKHHYHSVMVTAEYFHSEPFKGRDLLVHSCPDCSETWVDYPVMN